jgi:hypothetical protein
MANNSNQVEMSFPVRMIARAYFTVDGQVWVAIETNRGDVEIYRIEDQIEMFKGYISNTTIPRQVRAAALNSLWVNPFGTSTDAQHPLPEVFI